MASQDDIRENAQKLLFGLEDYSSSGRGNTYTPDAILWVGSWWFTLELKSKPELRWDSKSQSLKKAYGVSTARGFGAPKAQEWERKIDAFLFSEFEGKDFNDNFTEHYVLTYDHLRPVVEDKVLKPYFEGRKRYLGMREWDEIAKPLLGSLPQEMVERMQYTLERGTALNDPKFPWKEIKARGTLVSTREELEEFCLEHCTKRN